MFITNKCQRHWLRRRHWPSSPSRKEEEEKKKRHLTSETVISKTNGVWRTRSKVTKHFPSQHIPHTPQASRCWVQTAWNSLLTCVLQLMKSGKLKILLRYTGIHVRRDKEERKRGEGGEKNSIINIILDIWTLILNPLNVSYSSPKPGSIRTKFTENCIYLSKKLLYSAKIFNL